MGEWKKLFAPVSVFGFFLRPCFPTRPGGDHLCEFDEKLDGLAASSF